MYYSIRHITRFRYSDPITESVLEVRMQPRTEAGQRCFSFDLRTTPKTWIGSFIDDLANRVHYFDLPDRHTHLTIRAESLVELLPISPVPTHLEPETWAELDAVTATDEYWDTLQPSRFARPTEALLALAKELRLQRGPDPLSTLHDLNTAVHDAFEYDTDSTDVDSPIDEAISSRRGVCQDFAHIMIALVRELGIPCRYVSGYLFHQARREAGANAAEHDRSPSDATHAWVEALLPHLGWVGFDPTNNLIALERHIRVAVGRDYADVPPTRGVFKGQAETELAVSVRVTPSMAPPPPGPEEDEPEPLFHPTRELDAREEGEIHEQPQQ